MCVFISTLTYTYAFRMIPCVLSYTELWFILHVVYLCIDEVLFLFFNYLPIKQLNYFQSLGLWHNLVGRVFA